MIVMSSDDFVELMQATNDAVESDDTIKKHILILEVMSILQEVAEANEIEVIC